MPTRSHRSYSLSACLIGAKVQSDGSKSYAVYEVKVVFRDTIGREDLWHVFRRYSDFYDFHSVIVVKFLDLASVSFPAKKILNNLGASFLEKRKAELDEWLCAIISPPCLLSHPGLQDLMLRFLDPNSAYHQQINVTLAQRVEESFKIAVKSVPDTVDGMIDGARRLTQKMGHANRQNEQGVGANRLDTYIYLITFIHSYNKNNNITQITKLGSGKS